jgi:hypothetical protein
MYLSPKRNLIKKRSLAMLTKEGAFIEQLTDKMTANKKQADTIYLALNR